MPQVERELLVERIQVFQSKVSDDRRKAFASYILDYFSEGEDDTELFDVVTVIDGDTFDILDGNTELRIRLLGVDTPEV
ncbi:MAG: hypothetical protein H6765_01930 [Candidatus Peribacteria bacterium]|nr:MAG: hypothetical protein H6765_01930 [Candidatus Peribacteria bacterium]